MTFHFNTVPQLGDDWMFRLLVGLFRTPLFETVWSLCFSKVRAIPITHMLSHFLQNLSYHGQGMLLSW